MKPGAAEEHEDSELEGRGKKSSNEGDLESAERREEGLAMGGRRKEATIRKAFQGVGVHSDLYLLN